MFSGPRLDLERDLNPDQIAAVTHGDGPQLVIAGAGSGKTRVITYRVAWLVNERDVDPSRISAVTFTNKAAAEMRDRVADLLGYSSLPTFVGTFHRFALVLLRRYPDQVGLKRDFGILDSGDQRALVKKALSDEGLSEKAFPPNAVLGAISSAKNKLLDPARYADEADNFYTRRVAQVYRRYQGLLHEASGVDFDDMIALAVRLLEGDGDVCERVRWRAQHLLVDEYQDTNFAQLRLIELLAGETMNLTAVGDEDQGIYRWRGAELSNILEFERSFPGAAVRKLERNYRSTQNILDAAGAVVENNTQRRGKKLWTDAGAGEQLELYRSTDEGDEARWVVNTLLELSGEHGNGGYELSDTAVLVRTNAQTRALEEELLRREVPYQLIGGVRFYERAEIKDLVAYLRVLRNPRDTLSLSRIINQPPRGIGKTTLERLNETAASLGQPIWDVLYQGELGDFPRRSAAALTRFRDLIVNLQRLNEGLAPHTVLEQLVEATGYAKLFDEDEPEGQAKLENIREFLSAAREFAERAEPVDETEVDTLTAFLDHVSLISDLDSAESAKGVTLMTLHSAKGLEFPVVVLPGLEDGLLPHFNSQGQPEDLEEERRLLYVGMTRAEKRLFLSHCRRRRIAGMYQDRKESPFLVEVPGELVNVTQSPSLFDSPHRRQVDSFFGRGGDRRGGGRTSHSPFAQEPEEGLAKGRRVSHPSLGEGTVLEASGDGSNAKIVVFFDRAGKRKLLAKYANLELL